MIVPTELPFSTKLKLDALVKVGALSFRLVTVIVRSLDIDRSALSVALRVIE